MSTIDSPFRGRGTPASPVDSSHFAGAKIAGPATHCLTERFMLSIQPLYFLLFPQVIRTLPVHDSLMLVLQKTH